MMPILLSLSWTLAVIGDFALRVSTKSGGVGRLKMREWKMKEQITGVEKARVNRMERQLEIILRKT